jgi:hypothetical protein
MVLQKQKSIHLYWCTIHPHPLKGLKAYSTTSYNANIHVKIKIQWIQYFFNTYSIGTITRMRRSHTCTLLIQVWHLLTFFVGPFWLFLTFYFYLGIIRTTGRYEGKNLSNIRFEIKYIILRVDPFALSYIWNAFVNLICMHIIAKWRKQSIFDLVIQLHFFYYDSGFVYKCFVRLSVSLTLQIFEYYQHLPKMV